MKIRENSLVSVAASAAGTKPRKLPRWVDARIRSSEFGVVNTIVRSLLLAALATACAGCVGLSIDLPRTQEIQNPVPLKVKKAFGGDSDFERWACQPDTGPSTRNNFLLAWGAPSEKVATTKGETWIYAESGRWCGLWIFAILPVPLVLPVCETFDKVDFEGEVAVNSVSRRISGLSMGVGLSPYSFPLIPFVIRPGRITENRPQVLAFPGTQLNLACARPAVSAGEDLVSCVASGARQWTYRSKCD